MEARLDAFSNTVITKFGKYINSAGKVVTESALPAATQELVEIRASQINGCGFCTDMHTKDAAHAGESSVRINLVAAWRESTVFTEAERAALELTEQGTRIADAAGGVTDEAWANAAKHYDEEQLTALVSLIALINAFNRVNVIVQQPAGAPAPPPSEPGNRPVPAGPPPLLCLRSRLLTVNDQRSAGSAGLLTLVDAEPGEQAVPGRRDALLRPVPLRT